MVTADSKSERVSTQLATKHFPNIYRLSYYFIMVLIALPSGGHDFLSMMRCTLSLLCTKILFIHSDNKAFLIEILLRLTK